MVIIGNQDAHSFAQSHMLRKPWWRTNTEGQMSLLWRFFLLCKPIVNSFASPHIVWWMLLKSGKPIAFFTRRVFPEGATHLEEHLPQVLRAGWKTGWVFSAADSVWSLWKSVRTIASQITPKKWRSHLALRPLGLKYPLGWYAKLGEALPGISTVHRSPFAYRW